MNGPRAAGDVSPPPVPGSGIRRAAGRFGALLPGLLLASAAVAAGPVAVAVAPAAAQEPAVRELPPGTELEPSPPFRAPPPRALEGRRSRLLDSIGTGTVVLRSASPVDPEAEYPQDSDFRQNNDFLYFTGLEAHDSWLLLAASSEGERTQILFLPERDTLEERWTGARLSRPEAAEMSGIADVRDTEDFHELVEAGALSGLGGPLFLPLRRAALADHGEDLLREIVRDASTEVRTVEPLVDQLRLVKDDFELEMLRRAIEVTGSAQRAAMEAARPGMYEYELEAVIEYVFRRGGAERVGFPSIVGSGPNSVVLHYDRNRRQMEEGDVVLMDVGAEYSYYTADITRTIPVSGSWSDRQRAIYELVLGAQEAGIEVVRPGATMQDVSRAARSYLSENSGDLCGRRSCAEFLVHGIGHWLGMDVHDVGSYTTPFQAGMVFTVEPGVYLPDEGLGIRIEDDVLVTEDGHEVLSGASPRDPDEIEQLMRD